MDVSPKQLVPLLKKVLAAKLTPMIHGSPGIGKSEIIHKLTQEYKLKLIDLRLSQSDPVDMSGLISFNANRTKSQYIPMDVFPIETDEIPEGFNGWLVFLDELPSASLAVQAAAYKLILDRQVGQHNLHPNVWIVCAGNLSTDKAIVNRMGTAMQSRMVHFNLKVNVEDWLDWFTENNGDYRIRSFINFKPGLLHSFNPNHSDNTFPAPRTWFFLSEMIKGCETISHDLLPLIAGTIGEGAAYEFKAFIEVMESLPSFNKMLNDPENIPIPTDPSIVYAMGGIISHRASKDNIDRLMVLINRFPLEFQIITLQDTIKHHKELLSSKALNDWISNNTSVLSRRGLI